MKMNIKNIMNIKINIFDKVKKLNTRNKILISAAIAVPILALVLMLTANGDSASEGIGSEGNPDDTKGHIDKKLEELSDLEPSQNIHTDDPEETIDDSEEKDSNKTNFIKGEPYSKQLVSSSSQNILIMGQDEDVRMDTLGIISIDQDSEEVRIIMIPRDMYVEYNDSIQKYMKNRDLYYSPGTFKINYTYYLGYLMQHEGKFSEISHGVSFLVEVIEEKFNLEIDDFVKIDTNGFVKVVDLFGGVDIEVPYDMYYTDATYENDEDDLYIKLNKGPQHLDGKQAEGFVRFRKGTDRNGENAFEIGDIQRKENQIDFLKAFTNQHLKISNINKIDDFINIINRNVWSSIKGKGKISEYVKFAKDIIINDYDIESEAISGKFKTILNSSHIIVE